MADPDAALIETTLHAALDRAEPPHLLEALTDAVFPGGARIRPRLCMAVCRATGGDPIGAAAAAAAVELLHCASLVHDDLPCFDDADTRRGRPSIHRKHGEATAVLVGDALIVAAFETLAAARAPSDAMLLLARAAGARGGLVSGQALELCKDVGVDRYHRAKTAGLFEVAVTLGLSGAVADREPFAAFGRRIGLFYQLADDALDRFGDAAAAGKPIGRDAVLQRPSAFASAVEYESASSTLRAGAAEVVRLVPPCDGREELRRFVQTLLDPLLARLQRAESGT